MSLRQTLPKQEANPVAFVENAAGRNTAFLSFPAANVQHRRRGLYHGESPLRIFPGEVDQLVTSSSPNAKNPRCNGQIGEHRTHEQMQCVAHGSQFGESLVVGGGCAWSKATRGS